MQSLSMEEEEEEDGVERGKGSCEKQIRGKGLGGRGGSLFWQKCAKKEEEDQVKKARGNALFSAPSPPPPFPRVSCRYVSGARRAVQKEESAFTKKKKSGRMLFPERFSTESEINLVIHGPNLA